MSKRPYPGLEQLICFRHCQNNSDPIRFGFDRIKIHSIGLCARKQLNTLLVTVNFCNAIKLIFKSFTITWGRDTYKKTKFIPFCTI
jgi:hypothetical protein